MSSSTRTDWRSDYVVTADFIPFRKWKVRAEGEAAARIEVGQKIGVEIELLCASLDDSPQQGDK